MTIYCIVVHTHKNVRTIYQKASMSELDACPPISKTLIYTHPHICSPYATKRLPHRFIMEAAIKARILDRYCLLNPIKMVENNQEDKMFLVTTCHPNDRTY